MGKIINSYGREVEVDDPDHMRRALEKGNGARILQPIEGADVNPKASPSGNSPPGSGTPSAPEPQPSGGSGAAEKQTPAKAARTAPPKKDPDAPAGETPKDRRNRLRRERRAAAKQGK